MIFKTFPQSAWSPLCFIFLKLLAVTDQPVQPCLACTPCVLSAPIQLLEYQYIMRWRLDLINKLTPPAAAAQHVYYCGNRNGSSSSSSRNTVF